MQQINTIHDQAIITELSSFPDQPFIWEIITGKPAGKIYQLAGDAIIIIENGSQPFVFIAGEFNEEAFEQVVLMLQNRESPMIYCKPMYHRLFLAHGWNLNLRIALQLKKSVKHQSLDKRLVWKKIDNHELFKKCFWYQWFCELYLSADNFLQYASGFALCLGDQVVSEVYDTVGNGYVEISIATNLAHRGKGYALQALAALLEKYEGSSLVPLWTCDADNKASLNTALKMGFEITKYDVWLKV